MEFSVTKLLINNEFTIWKQLPPGSTMMQIMAKPWKFSDFRGFVLLEPGPVWFFESLNPDCEV
jgi:hypothetical protein